MVPPSTGLPLAAWSAEADVGAERRNPVPYRGHRDVLRADAPPKARRATPNRRRARSDQTARRLPHGTSRGLSGNRGTPRYSMTSSRGAWRCKRGRGHSLAVRTNRNAGIRIAPKPCSRPLSDTDTPEPPHWTASVKASRALSQHLLRLRPSRTARRRIAHHHSATPRPPRARDASPGRGRLHCVRRGPAGGAGATGPDALSGRVACGCRGEPLRRPSRGTAFRRR